MKLHADKCKEINILMNFMLFVLKIVDFLYINYRYLKVTFSLLDSSLRSNKILLNNAIQLQKYFEIISIKRFILSNCICDARQSREKCVMNNPQGTSRYSIDKEVHRFVMVWDW